MWQKCVAVVKKKGHFYNCFETKEHNSFGGWGGVMKSTKDKSGEGGGGTKIGF